jgi:hypothetical protein
MTDDEFLGYVLIHSETELHLFSGAQIKRLCELAGAPVPSIGDADWYGVEQWTAEPLVKKAYERMRAKEKAKIKQPVYVYTATIISKEPLDRDTLSERAENDYPGYVRVAIAYEGVQHEAAEYELEDWFEDDDEEDDK